MTNETLAIPADPTDPDDFAVSAEGAEQGLRAREIRVTRTNLGLSQAVFSSRYKIPLDTLKAWEQARVMAPDFAVAYVRVIAQHPDLVAKAVA